MKVQLLTLYPEMFPGALGHSLPGAALAKGLWSLEAHDIRAHATDRHGSVDDTPYGGGAGMVMKPDVVGSAIDAALARLPGALLISLSPRGQPLTQALSASLAMQARAQGCIMLCGRFEGIDERVNAVYQPLEVSIGDYILFGGELAAMVLLEAMLRHLPGVLGNAATHADESFSIGEESACILEYPHYTKPPLWKGFAVPDVLLSGHHGKVAAWRKAQAEALTRIRRADLWQQYIASGAVPEAVEQDDEPSTDD